MGLWKPLNKFNYSALQCKFEVFTKSKDIKSYVDTDGNIIIEQTMDNPYSEKVLWQTQ